MAKAIAKAVVFFVFLRIGSITVAALLVYVLDDHVKVWSPF